jgi:uncharacterized membrane protein
MGAGLLAQRLVVLFAAGALLFGFPLLWRSDAVWLGLPLLPLALFASWAGLIAVLAVLMEVGQEAGPESRPETGQDG